MKKTIITTFVILISIGTGYSQPRYTSYLQVKNAISIAWNEDEINKWVLVTQEGGKFVYIVSHKDITSGITKTENYFGSFRALTNRDTVWLKYDNSKKPEGALDYIVIETSRAYLIQPFSDKRKRIFLRVLHRDRHLDNWR